MSIRTNRIESVADLLVDAEQRELSFAVAERRVPLLCELGIWDARERISEVEDECNENILDLELRLDLCISEDGGDAKWEESILHRWTAQRSESPLPEAVIVAGFNSLVVSKIAQVAIDTFESDGAAWIADWELAWLHPDVRSEGTLEYSRLIRSKSCRLVSEVIDATAAAKSNLVVGVSGMTNSEVIKKLKSLKSEGYSVSVILVHEPLEEAWDHRQLRNANLSDEFELSASASKQTFIAEYEKAQDYASELLSGDYFDSVATLNGDGELVTFETPVDDRNLEPHDQSERKIKLGPFGKASSEFDEPEAKDEKSSARRKFRIGKIAKQKVSETTSQIERHEENLEAREEAAEPMRNALHHSNLQDTPESPPVASSIETEQADRETPPTIETLDFEDQPSAEPRQPHDTLVHPAAQDIDLSKFPSRERKAIEKRMGYQQKLRDSI